MDYLAIKDLKKPKMVREKLVAERELVLTRDGSPFAVIVSVEPDAVEDAIGEIRRALFSTSVARIRRRAAGAITAADVAREVRAVRGRR